MRKVNLDPLWEKQPLRVTELMIGDWIHTPKGEMKIRAISQNGTVRCGMSTSPSEWEEFTEYEISPIALSWDTLMNNGFVDRSSDPAYASCELEDPENNLKVRLEDLSFGMACSWFCMVLSTCDSDNMIPQIKLKGVSHVHELQHILHLAGVTVHSNRNDLFWAE